MKKIQNNDRLIDEQLAAFTDNILDGKTGEHEDLTTMDSGLRALQQTVLRLKNTFPDDGPSAEAIQRMRQNVIQQWQEQESKSRAPFWMKPLSSRPTQGQKWQSQRSQRRWSLAIFVATAGFLLLVTTPLMNKVSSGQPAASGQNPIFSIAIILGGFVILAVWAFLRNR